MSYERSRDVDTFPASWCPSFSFCNPESFSIDGFERFSRPVLFQMFVCVLPSVTKMRVFKVNFILGEDFN